MKKALLPLAIAATLPLTTLAAGPIDGTIYGKINVSTVQADDGTDTTTELNSNASRIGFKGKTELSNGLYAIYKAEYEIHVDDGTSGSSKDSDTFEQRNIYVGLTGGFGTIFAGKHDTNLKLAQKKVDLFNDLEGDIKHLISKSENRASNSVVYASPKFGPVQFNAGYIASEDDDVDNGTSLSLSYDNKGVYLAVAYDQDVEKETADVLRVVGQFKFGDLQLGALYEDQDAGESSLNDGDAWFVSAKYNLGAGFALKGQYGESDIVEEGGESMSLGLDYKLAKATKVYGFYTANEADSGLDEDYFGLGMEHKF